jgi:sigma-E factor negative regulatory protein RseA
MNPHRQSPDPADAAAPTDADERQRFTLSALVDGELDAQELGRGCAAWAGDEDLRRTWHAYQLIGDVLRSDDLASPPSRDAALLAALRVRLAAEPVVMAPTAAPLARVRRAGWRVPVAIAAGVVAVAGVVSVLEPALLGTPGGPALAALPGGGAAPGVVQVGLTPPSRDQMLRDARVDEYLRAHRDAFAGSPVALPGGALRSVEFQPPQR